MSQYQHLEAIAQQIEQYAVKAGRALADYLAQHSADVLLEFDFDRHRIAGYIFHRTATDVLDKFHASIGDDEGALGEQAIATVKTAFGKRLAELMAARPETLSAAARASASGRSRSCRSLARVR